MCILNKRSDTYILAKISTSTMMKLKISGKTRRWGFMLDGVGLIIGANIPSRYMITMKRPMHGSIAILLRCKLTTAIERLPVDS